MAEAVHSFPRLRGVWPALAISPPAAYAIRFGVAVSAALWIGKAPGLVENQSKWILITVLMLVQPTTGAALMKGLLRAAGTVAGACTAILLFGFFAQDPPLLLAGLFLVQAIGAYGYSGRRFQYAWFVMAFTTAIVLGGAMAGQDAVETVAFQRAGRSAALEGRVADLRDLVAVLRAVEAVLSLVDGPRAEAQSGSGWRFRPDPFRTKIALRGGIAVIAAFLVPMSLGWPVKAAVAPIAFMIAVLTRGAAVLTLASFAAMLALGWLVADLSIVYVAPHLGRAPLALIVPFALAAAFA